MKKSIFITKGNYFIVTQKIGDFFVCKMTPKQLREIVKEDLSRYSSLDEIQRDRDSKRLERISEFIYNKDYATFPNTFIISVSNDSRVVNGDFEIISDGNDAYILDGQHRLYGFKEDEEDFEIIVSVYVGLSRFHQAMIFANINGEQIKVNKSLVYSLYGFGNDRSVENITYAIINGLNQDDASPLQNKIKILGKGNGVLSLAPFFEELRSLLSQFDPSEVDKIRKSNILDIDRQIKLIGDMHINILSKLYLFGEIKYKNDIFILENKYKDDFIKLNEEKERLSFFREEDQMIYNKINTYYRVLSTSFQNYWESSNSIIFKTTGFYAFFRLFEDIISNISKLDEIDKFNEDFLIKIFEIITPNLDELTSENYVSGIKGQNDLYKDITKQLGVDKITQLLSGNENIVVKNIANKFMDAIANSNLSGKRVTFKESLEYGINPGEEKRFSEIVSQITKSINEGVIYIDSKGKTPYDTLSAILSRDCSDIFKRLPGNLIRRIK